MRNVCLILVAACLVGCTTRPKQYAPPNPAKVNAATAQVKRDSVKSHEIADEIIVLSNDLDREQEVILDKAPETLKPLITAWMSGFDGLQRRNWNNT